MFCEAVIRLGNHFHFVLERFIILGLFDEGEELSQLEIFGLTD
jgi:hypothetical protein